MAARSIRTPRATVERLHELFEYLPELGALRRKVFACRGTGKPRSKEVQSKHREIYVDGERLLEHRVIWAMHNGVWPDCAIDHQDLNTRNNRIENLRPASWTQNQANQRKPKHNTSGFKGVSWHKQRAKWCARISLGGKKSRHLGLFDTPEQAHTAYEAAVKSIHGEFARTK